MPLPRPNNTRIPPAVPSQFVPQALAAQLGVGIAAPIIFDPITQTWNSLGGVSMIEQEMLVCLQTPINRRLGQPDYGSELPYMVFEQYTATLKREMTRATSGALGAWVQEITVVNVFFDETQLADNIVIIQIVYMVKGTSATGTLLTAIPVNDAVIFPPGTFTINGVPLIKAPT